MGHCNTQRANWQARAQSKRRCLYLQRRDDDVPQPPASVDSSLGFRREFKFLDCLARPAVAGRVSQPGD